MQPVTVYYTVIVFSYIFTVLGILALGFVYVLALANEYGKKYETLDVGVYKIQLNFFRITGLLLLFSAWILGSGESLDSAVKLSHLSKNMFISGLFWLSAGAVGLVSALFTIVFKFNSIAPKDLCKMAVVSVIWGIVLVVAAMFIFN